MSDTYRPPDPVAMPGLDGHGSPALAEADRLMTICNACRYCSGLCAVFPAMERRRVFADGDLEFLANLCHNCGACLYDCQYAPPHEFDVGVPSNLAELRTETWERYAWPSAFAALYRNNPLATALTVVAAVAAFVVGVAVSMGADMFAAHTGEGAFYEVVAHDPLIVIFGLAFGYGLLAIGLSVRRFWRAIGGGGVTLGDLAGAGRSASTLEYLDGGGVGCMNEDEHPTDNRRRFHHLTYYGFAACFAATTLAAILETGFGTEPPYALWHPVVLLGTFGGIGLLVGPIGLWRAKAARDDQLTDVDSRPLEVAFLLMLLLLSVTGLATLALRATAAMPLLLAIHLGVVFAFFVTLPYGKFVHGFYRYAALVKNAQERRTR